MDRRSVWVEGVGVLGGDCSVKGLSPYDITLELENFTSQITTVLITVTNLLSFRSQSRRSARTTSSTRCRTARRISTSSVR